jgi:hypothetical protein
MGGQRLNAPIVGIAADAQGGIFSFGPGAKFCGSMGGTSLAGADHRDDGFDVGSGLLDGGL